MNDAVIVRVAIAVLASAIAACGPPTAPGGLQASTDQNGVDPIVSRIDHLVFAVADLDDGIRQLEAVTGVRAAFGGAHSGQGSHNALLALGRRVYLEIVAPDPAQANPRSLPSLGLRKTRRSRMVGWALDAPDIEGLIADAGVKGFPMAGPTPGERQRPDGYRLSWRIATLADSRIGEGLAPFLHRLGRHGAPDGRVAEGGSAGEPTCAVPGSAIGAGGLRCARYSVGRQGRGRACADCGSRYTARPRRTAMTPRSLPTDAPRSTPGRTAPAIRSRFSRVVTVGAPSAGGLDANFRRAGRCG